MCKYNTPKPIVDVIAKHVPKNIITLLDPAVGEGSLIYPFIRRNLANIKKVVCIDIEQAALIKVQNQYRALLGESLELFHNDFIQWSSPLSKLESYFDCIVMNPPFCGRNDVLIKINMQDESSETTISYKHVPIEIAFIIRAIRLLKPFGKLFAVLPSSLVTSERMIWVRKFMIKMGAVLYVYEFPRYSFKRVEGRTYLLIFKKSTKHNNIVVTNKDSQASSRILINRSELTNNYRFDYAFQSAYRRYNKLIESSPYLKWEKVDNLLQIYRGSVKSPLNGKLAIHTSNFKGYHWQISSDEDQYTTDYSMRGIQNGDLLVKRVGRNCSQSIGLALNLQGIACTDCVFVLRPKKTKWSISILLALRIIANSTIGSKLIERGIGAKYIAAKSLLNLMIPIGVYESNPQCFRNYSYAVKKIMIESMLSIENKIRKNSKLYL